MIKQLFNIGCLLIVVIFVGCEVSTGPEAIASSSTCTTIQDDMTAAAEACENEDGSSGYPLCESGTLEECKAQINAYAAWYSSMACNPNWSSYDDAALLQGCEDAHGGG